MSHSALPGSDAAHQFMGEALDLARQSLEAGDLPIGAVIVVDGEIIAARHNERALANDPTGHAEVLAVRDAAAVLGDRRLHRAICVVTLEPCPMCAGVLWAAQIGGVVFGASDPRAGALGSLYNLATDPRLNWEFPVLSGVRAEESAELLTGFFAARR